ncbi:MAG: SIMPL domain-containing protein [Treponema sp.]|jgi:uncharacterized protein YggE|nr:SIMPL domain-containing protein [Treponema sp.]
MKLLLIIWLFSLLFLGCTKENTPSTLSVIGIGTVLAQPDMIQITISLSELAHTTRQAQEEVNKKVKQILSLLKKENVEEKSISTPSLRFNQEYEWRNQRKHLVGQRVEQIITFSLYDIQKDAEKTPRILDKIAQIDNITLNTINLSIKDNKDFFVRSRELAYQKALEKAMQYAKLSGLKIIKALDISEREVPHISAISNSMMNMQLNVLRDGLTEETGSTILPTGELEISSHISVTFLLK